MSQKNVEIVRCGVKAFTRGDWNELVARYDANVVVHNDPSWPEAVISGRDAVIDWFRSVWELIGPGIRIEEIQDLGDGDRVLVRLCWTMKGVRSGVEGDMRWTQIATLRDGRIAVVEQFIDHAEALKAVGLSG
jgi:ketosteroid isomerase-like protein